MAAEEGNGDIVRYIYRGQPRAEIPRHVTHVTVKDIKAVPAGSFAGHPNIQEVVCHDGVLKIEQEAFYNCISLRRVIMPGVKEVEREAFCSCWLLNYIEWPKLEIIHEWAFGGCSLSGIDLPSIIEIGHQAFDGCTNVTSVKLGEDLCSLYGIAAFCGCTSLERITLPLRDDMFGKRDIFQACGKLHRVDLIEGAILNETVAALPFDVWKNDMSNEIDSINQILPNTPYGSTEYRDDGEKAQVIRRWISSVLRKIVQYKAEHRHIMDEAAATLQFVLPQDIVRNNVLSFLELPSYTFDGEDDEEEEEDSDYDEEMEEEE